MFVVAESEVLVIADEILMGCMLGSLGSVLLVERFGSYSHV